MAAAEPDVEPFAPDVTADGAAVEDAALAVVPPVADTPGVDDVEDPPVLADPAPPAPLVADPAVPLAPAAPAAGVELAVPVPVVEAALPEADAGDSEPFAEAPVVAPVEAVEAEVPDTRVDVVVTFFWLAAASDEAVPDLAASDLAAVLSSAFPSIVTPGLLRLECLVCFAINLPVRGAAGSSTY